MVKGASMEADEALASFVALLSRWDPNVARTQDIRHDWAECAYLHAPENGDKYYNSNDCASMRNNYLALWEFIDTSTEDADAYADYFDLTVKDLMDSLVLFRDAHGSPGQNRTADELYFVNTGATCEWAVDCGPGEVCNLKHCQAGDPHGSNIRDWLYHLARYLGHPEWESLMWQTLVSSKCVGRAQNSWPFVGGYHSD